MMISAPFAGDRSKIVQVDPGKFQDTATGNYYTGTFDNATNWGTDYSKVGVADTPNNYPGSTLGAPTGSTPYGADGRGINVDAPAAPKDPYAGLAGGVSPTTPAGRISQVDPGRYVDESNNLWSGTWAQPFFQGRWGGPTPGANNWVSNPSAPTSTAPTRQPDNPYQPTTTQGTQPNQPANQGTQPLPRSAPPAFDPQKYGGMSQTDTITKMYQDLLGRTPGADEYALHAGNPGGVAGIWQAILSSPEYQQLQPQAPGELSGMPRGVSWWPNEGYPAGPAAGSTGQWTGDPSNVAAWVAANAGSIHPGNSSQDPNYWIQRINENGGLGGAYGPDYWFKRMTMSDADYNAGQGPTPGPGASPGGTGTNGYPTGTPGAAVPPGGSYSPTNPFDDPATKNYIDLLNSRIQELLKPHTDPSMDQFRQLLEQQSNALRTPYTNPDAGPLQDWMRKYFAQLQGPTYTPGQQDIIATHVLDPMERQRQAELKNVAHVMASRGITPGSGPFLSAERDINQKFDALRAQTQSGLAVNEINQGRQDQARAAGVGGQLAEFTQNQFGNNENRANKGTSLFGSIPQLNLQEFQNQDARANQAVTAAKGIPDLAQQRVLQAIQMLNGSTVNPASLLSPLAQFQQQGLGQGQQDSTYWQNIIAAMAKQFGL